MTTFSPEQLRSVFDRLPRPIREYLLSTKLYDFSQQLMQKYSLRPDTAGEINNLAGYMLAGLVNPKQFESELRTLGIPDQAVNSMIHDLNEQVFKPLHDAVKSAPPEEPQEVASSAPAPSAAPAPRPVAAPPTPRTPAAPPVPAMRVEVKTPPPPPANLPGAPMPTMSAPAPQPSAAPPPPRPAAPPPRPAPNPHEILKSYGVDPYREQPE